MGKKVLIMLFGLITVGTNYFTAQTFNKNKKNIQKEKLKSPKLTPTYPTSDKVTFNIEVKKEYDFNKPIEIVLVWKNNSTSTEKIMIRDYWKHPIGTGASIKDSNNVELASYASSHILSSHLFTSKELKKYEIELKPNDIKKHPVDLLKIPFFKKSIKNLSKGKYKIQVFYYSEKSNIVEIIVK